MRARTPGTSVVFKDDHLAFWLEVSLKAIYGYDALLIFPKDRAANAYDAIFSRKTNCDLVLKILSPPVLVSVVMPFSSHKNLAFT